MRTLRTGITGAPRGRLALLLGVWSLTIGGSLLGALPAKAQDQQVQIIELTAKKYEYSPVPVHVKAGTRVQLKITAVDHDHGFKISTVAKGADKNSNPGWSLPRRRTAGS